MPVSRGFFIKSLVLTQIEEQSLSTFVTRLVTILNISMSGLNLSKLNSITTSTFNTYPNYLHAYFRSFVTLTVQILFIMIYFLCKKEYRKSVSNELIDTFVVLKKNMKN